MYKINQMKCVSRFYSCIDIFILKRSVGNVHIKSIIENNLKCVKVDNCNIVDGLDINEFVSLDNLYRYLNRGDIGLFAYTDGKCVGQVWAAIGPLMLEYNGLYSIEILDNSFYIHDVYTAKNYRNHRISSILLSYLLKVIECQVGYVIIDKKNIASLKVHMRMGFKPYMDVKAWRFWKFISRSVKKVEDGK